MKDVIEELLVWWGINDFEIKQEKSLPLGYQINIYGDRILIKILWLQGAGRELSRLSFTQKFDYSCSFKGKRGLVSRFLKFIFNKKE